MHKVVNVIALSLLTPILLIVIREDTLAKTSVPKPPLREQISLNGTWDEGGTVPEYMGVAGLDQRTYCRLVTVPAGWTNKHIKLEFGAINFIGEIYVNKELLLRHVGGWNPFTVDITDKVTPGSIFELKVIVKGPKHAPIVDERGKFQWPVGGWSNKGGIADDVYLRAYGAVHIEDAFIKTSVGEKRLTVDYTLKNEDTKERTVTIQSDAVKASGGRVEKKLQSTVTLAPGERRVVTVSETWTTPTLYWPDAPALYLLKSRLLENDSVVDQETRRFGFREIKIVGNQFTWNNVRINLFGEYQAFGNAYYVSPTLHMPANWPGTIDKLKDMNIRVLRWHHNPVPQYVLDVMDEKGLLACDESANYARDYHKETNKAIYVANFKKWVEAWIKADRNHPSVYIWNATNEMTYPHLSGFSDGQCREMGDAIRRYDTTRPVGYDGDAGNGRKKYGNVEDVCLNHHYPEGYNKEPRGSIYSWGSMVHPSKPTGAGELLHTKSPLPEVQAAVERNRWWLGIWTRGMRYTNWTDVRPAWYWFASKDMENPDPLWQVRGMNMRNALAPVALFDKEYDDLGITPYVTGTTPGGRLPAVEAGSTAKRALILYNDEFRDTRVTVEVLIKSGGRIYAEGRRTFNVPLGEHIDFPCSFQVPYAVGRQMELVLITRKRGVQKFEETRRFTVTDSETHGRSSRRVVIGGPSS